MGRKCAVCSSVTLDPTHHSCPAHWLYITWLEWQVGPGVDLHTLARRRRGDESDTYVKAQHKNTNILAVTTYMALNLKNNKIIIQIGQ